MTEVSALGAIVGLVVAIIMILKKIPPVYSLITGALTGGLVGGANIVETVDLMIGGAQGIMPAVLRILAAGVLAGVLIESGAASKLAQTIVSIFGQKKALLALALATMLLTSVGVFVDVAVITVAPIALVIAKQAKLSRMAILIAMVGGGKAGNIMSPNPNTIAISEAFDVSLTSVMAAGIIPAIFGVTVTYFISKRISTKGTVIDGSEIEKEAEGELPSFWTAALAPIVAILLLVLRPLFDINVDPMIALPAGGLVGALVMGKWRQTNHFIKSGLGKMAPVAVLLIGTGAVAGIITNSTLDVALIGMLESLGLPAFALAPVSGIFMSAATASTTAGSAVASSVFGGAIIESGVAGLAGAAMVHAGATVLDHMPHGSFFHATAGSVGMQIQERLKLIPYETLVGLTMAIVSTLVYGVFQWFL
ncbi:GntP family permease [Alkalihalobacillus trypoxylicola]|uniref:Gluconate:proton symporter n=1 Tax=Alkalihalobacillus trypoxylicola TaxID=519424 RepID=A0A161QFS6_9BACI|nr:SLC13 family permease [Alkalihalobacillus trypoxylicola]KYG27739.1 gluconate:proton symporter [Alkalihalobacillus trypoxylicola]